MAYIFCTLIITAASKPLARTIAATFGGRLGLAMNVVDYSEVI
jgi:hypothetical protein